MGVEQMRKSEYKRVAHKESWIQDRFRSRHFLGVSVKWERWAKKYLSKAGRRSAKI